MDKADKIVRYDYIRLDPAKNGFTLSYECIKEDLSKPKGTFDPCCNWDKAEQEVFQTSDSVSWDQAMDQAVERMKTLYKFNREQKSSEY